MTEVIVKGGDVQKALRIFKAKCKRSGIFNDLRKYTHFRKPSVKRREKRKRAAITRAQEDRELRKRADGAEGQP